MTGPKITRAPTIRQKWIITTFLLLFCELVFALTSEMTWLIPESRMNTTATNVRAAIEAFCDGPPMDQTKMKTRDVARLLHMDCF